MSTPDPTEVLEDVDESSDDDNDDAKDDKVPPTGTHQTTTSRTESVSSPRQPLRNVQQLNKR